ncbi:MAG: hypothetical protein ACRDTJ_18330, partial [Pseudonocardiaceae bacterium]
VSTVYEVRHRVLRERLEQMVATANRTPHEEYVRLALIDKLFPGVYERAYQLGMMISISSNGSRLSNRKILDLLTTYRQALRATGGRTGRPEPHRDGGTRLGRAHRPDSRRQPARASGDDHRDRRRGHRHGGTQLQ